MSQSVQVAIGANQIRQLDGLYSLNDLHTAAGGEAKHQPTNFLRLEQAQALVSEIQSSEMRTAVTTINGGTNRGTYACRELVIAYAAWISAAFHLKVIRVFLDQQQAASQFFSGKRWLVTFRDGKEVIQEIDWNDCLLKYEELPRLLAASDNMVSSQLLADIASACVQRLARQNANLNTTCNALRQQTRKAVTA